jgi:acylphosphatase
MSAVRFHVSGHVQGVMFRVSVREQAQRLGLRGYARNLPDGRVEVLAVGDDEVVEVLARWLHVGPPMSRVESVGREAASEVGVGALFEIA